MIALSSTDLEENETDRDNEQMLEIDEDNIRESWQRDFGLSI